jgi:hypothetical protein
MSPARKAPAVIVLTEESLVSFMAEIQKGLTDLSARLAALEEHITKPGLATVKLRKDLADAALKAAVSRPAPGRRPRKQV